MTWWVLTYHNYTRSWNELYTLAGTNVPDHLFMAWSTHKPSRKGIWRRVRGKEVFCGYKYTWDTPNITEQAEYGDTPWHSWWLKQLESDEHIWYYLFSPIGPYDLQVQGPLIHVPPPEVHLWTSRMIVGTKSKGIFRTTSFTGPGGDHPVWKSYNGGLLSLYIWQLEPDPMAVEYRHYCIAGDNWRRVLYKRVPPKKPGWFPILTWQQAKTLLAANNVNFHWVKTNVNVPSYVYLFVTFFTNGRQASLLVSPDYGQTWVPHDITPWPTRAWAVNLDIGISAGLSPYGPGAAMYCIQSTGAAFYETYIMRSTDYGHTWSRQARTGNWNAAPLIYVDPTDQSIVYVGGTEDGVHYYLYRSIDHGETIANVGPNDKFGPFIAPERGLLWINPADHRFLRALQDNHIWTTQDAGASWDDWGHTQIHVARHTALWENPSRIYLARHTSAPGPPPSILNHVIFVSDTHGIYMEGKAGANAWHFEGMGDSIPYNCGGLCNQGMMLYPPY